MLKHVFSFGYQKAGLQCAPISQKKLFMCLQCRKSRLTSILSMSQVRGDSDHPLLPDTHAPQALVQAVDHLVGSQQRLLVVLVVPSVGQEKKEALSVLSDLFI